MNKDPHDPKPPYVGEKFDMPEQSLEPEVHRLCDYGRRPYGFPVSRDWATLACKATGCRWNRNEHCMVPSRCKIGDDGRCQGFEAPPIEIGKKPDGD